MTNAEIFQLVCQILLLDEQPGLAENIEQKLSSNDLNIRKLILLSSNHLILSTVCRQLKEANLFVHFSNEFTEHLNDIYHLNTQRNLDILKQIDEINSHLEKENIEPVYLKGTANLMDGLYKSIGDRLIGDIDFLVKENDYLKTASLLTELGYKSKMKNYFAEKDVKHFPALIREDTTACVEIHRLPVNPEYSKRFNSEMIFTSKLPIKSKTNCYVPDNRHKLIHTFIHSQLINQGYNNRLLPLRDIYDFHLILSRVKKIDFFNDIEEHKKAKIFLNNVNYFLNGSSEKKYDKFDPGFRFFNQHNWLINHPNFQKRFYTYVKIKFLIFKKLPSLFLSKSLFMSLINRIFSFSWWKYHFTGG